jgi:hypothetical protein
MLLPFQTIIIMMAYDIFIKPDRRNAYEIPAERKDEDDGEDYQGYDEAGARLVEWEGGGGGGRADVWRPDIWE